MKTIAITVAAAGVAGLAAATLALAPAPAFAFEFESGQSGSLSGGAQLGEGGVLLGTDPTYGDPIQYHSHDDTTIAAPMMGGFGDSRDYASETLIPAPPAEAPAWTYSNPYFVHR